MIGKIQYISILFIFCFFIFIAPAFATGETTTLRMALLPIPDVLPIFVAQEKGFFKDLGIEVEVLPVGSALERDQLMQAGRIDGMINEISGAASFNRLKVEAQIISMARAPIGDSPLFRVLAAPNSKARKTADLKGVAIGISKNTVIEYVTDRLLAVDNAVANPQYISIPVLPERMQLLLSGQVEAVTLPDPLGAAAIAAGAVEIVNDTAAREYSGSVITFAATALAEKAEAVRSFMRAWDKACEALNSNAATFQQLMLKKIRVPASVQESYTIPPFPRKELPTREQWQDVMEWMVGKNLLTAPLAYDGSVTDEFLAR